MKKGRRKKQKQELYCVYDYDDPTYVLAIGTLDQLKDWWWGLLTGSTDVGGYALDKYSEIEDYLRENGEEDLIKEQLKECLLKTKKSK
jgi:hypothetical protein